MAQHPTPPLTILIVDDDPDELRSLAGHAEDKGFQTVSVTSGEGALEVARGTPLHLAIVDYQMPGMDGLVTVAKLKELQPGLRTVLLTGQGDEKLRQASESLAAPAFDKDHLNRLWEYIQEFGSHPGMIIVPPNVGEGGGMPSPIPHLGSSDAGRKPQPADPGGAFPMASDAVLEGLSRVVGETEAVSELKETISKVAALNCNVLLVGEPGTGKELVARTIHEISARRNQRFMSVNCGSFMPDVLVDELFGHEAGAFSGAHRSKRGAFEAASGGSLLLNEVGETPPSLQVQIQNVLERKGVTRLGGDTEVPMDTRVLAAADENIELLVRDGIFREDLYYQLNSFTISIPPLRERVDDIEILGSYFLNKCNRTFGKQVEVLSDEVLDLLGAYHFPGNVHELENVIERAVIVCDGNAILPRHLPERFRVVEASSRRMRRSYPPLSELERDYIYEVLDFTSGNRSEAAKVLGINRASLWRKLKRYEEEGE